LLYFAIQLIDQNPSFKKKSEISRNPNTLSENYLQTQANSDAKTAIDLILYFCRISYEKNYSDRR
jgi:hypothetical protein